MLVARSLEYNAAGQGDLAQSFSCYRAGVYISGMGKHDQHAISMSGVICLTWLSVKFSQYGFKVAGRGGKKRACRD
jgi:hypothetical protein